MALEMNFAILVLILTIMGLIFMQHVQLLMKCERVDQDGVLSSGVADAELGTKSAEIRINIKIGDERGLIAHQCISRTAHAFAISRTL